VRRGDFWTPAEDAILIPAYKAGGVMAALAALPKRRKAQIDGRLKHLGIRRFPTWTARRNEELTRFWGNVSLAVMAKHFEVSPTTVFRHAIRLGLGACPQGHEFLTTIAKRLGYDLPTFTRILRWAGVGVFLVYSNPNSPPLKRPRHFVDTADAEAAVDRWHKTETVTAAAKRLGYADFRTLLVRIEALGHSVVELGKRRYRTPLEDPGPTSPIVRVDATTRGRDDVRRTGSHVRVDSDLADRAAKLENMKQAAKRHGLYIGRLKALLLGAGVKPFGSSRRFRVKRGYLLDPAFVDQVVADSRRPKDTEGIASAAFRAGVNAATMSRWLRAAGFKTEGNRPWVLNPAEVDVVIEANLTKLAALRAARRVTRKAA
jgi:hypothetical protein